MASVLGIDCSTHVGFAFFASPTATPKLGTFKLPKSWAQEDYGPRFKSFHDWLCDVVTTFQPDVLAFEGPFLPRGSSSFSSTEHTLRTLIGLASIAELVAQLRDLRCFEVNVSTAKKRLTDDGRAQKSDMIIAATKLGYEVANDHEADAIAVVLCVYDMLEET
jgi:Holliday junction resolvasome RuvABC endonuclease subunit